MAWERLSKAFGCGFWALGHFYWLLCGGTVGVPNCIVRRKSLRKGHQRFLQANQMSCKSLTVPPEAVQCSKGDMDHLRESSSNVRVSFRPVNTAVPAGQFMKKYCLSLNPS